MKKLLGIIGAEQQEIDLLLEQLKMEQTMTRAGMKFFRGRLHGYPVVVVKAGIGKVNAAICTQLLIDQFHVELLINTGSAGSLDSRIRIGDVVLSTDLIQHDLDVRELGYERGMIPDTGKSFAADPVLRALARSSSKEANPDVGLFEGRIVSGDQFIAGKEKKEELIAEFHPLCAEMEGAAIAQTAALNQVPFLIVRAISDQADGSATMDYPQFSKQASIHSARMVEALVRRLSSADEI